MLNRLSNMQILKVRRMKLATLAVFAAFAVVLVPQTSFAAPDQGTTEEIRQAALAAGDPEAGKKIFKKCKACHKTGEGAKNGVGPMLTNIVGAQIGTVEGFKYSKGFIAKSETGEIWTLEALDTYLTKPRDFIAKTKMSFAGLKKEEDRANVVAFLTFAAGEE